ncbi:MAG TPA: tetratricopeptide repeat protein [Bryobacteraceae bacterium]|nr:tetratricopeptide repeat protein [Bryobacteraceae bacterium]
MSTALIVVQAALLAAPAAIMIDYPAQGSIFPPDLAPPTFLWRDPIDRSTVWTIEVNFGDAAAPLRISSRGERMQIGEVDTRCLAATNEYPWLTPQQEATRTWKPDSATWAAIRKHSVAQPATVTITGYSEADPAMPVSRASVTIRTAKEPVDAPIFFRDVPLMPAELKKGVIQPLPKPALPLVAWRLRYVNETSSRLLVDNLPTCMNCHSFSRDGKTFGLDVDGPQNDKGLYALVPITKQTTIRNEDVIRWSNFRGRLGGKLRIGFMSQVSPDGRYVVTMVNPSEMLGRRNAAPHSAANAPANDTPGNFYVANFKDYRFLQVFYPTRGILTWYSRATGRLQALPGADDPRYVHTNATWSPDGKYLVFARAEARDAYPEGSKLAETANDPNETQIRYDLYRIPFNDGKGGRAEPVAGASANGMSNSFPKISPDGRWIVYVQARNGLLMRPDSQLYIVPAEGGRPRRLSANTPLMNSWHSFSPNGRWLVFSSKARSPYTQMYLTRIDEQGSDSPPILIENATAANRAVNIPEFVNISAGAWLKIDAPATEFYRLSDNALEFMQGRDYASAITEWRRALEIEPDDTTALNNLGAALTESGQFDEAAAEFTKALRIDPENFKAHSNLGVALARTGKFEQARTTLEKALQISPDDARTRTTLGAVLMNLGRPEEAAAHLRRALEIAPNDADAHNNLGSVLSRQSKFDEAIPHFEKALAAEPNSVEIHFNLGRALAANGSLDTGIRHLEQALALGGSEQPAIAEKLSEMREALKARAAGAVPRK